MLALQKIENAMTGIKDKVILNHMENIATACHEIEHSGLKVAYHAANIAPLLEGNTDGLPTSYVDFCRTRFGIEKAQAYNIQHVGQHVALVYDENGKASTYIDTYTLDTIVHKYEDSEGMITDWKEYWKAVKKARSLGTTQILTIHRLRTRKKNPLNFEDSDISEMLDKGALSAGMTIKEFTKAIEGKFKAIETTATENTTESTTESTTEPTEPTEPTTTPTGKPNEKAYLIPESVLDEVYPELCRVAEECPHIASLIHMINEMGYKTK